MTACISTVKILDYVPTEVLNKGIERSLDLIGFKFDESIRTIAIKPNLCFYYDPSTGRTTDPRFVGAVVDLIREHASKDVEINVVESDASAMKCKHSFRILGYEQMSKLKDFRLVNLTEDETDEVETKVNGVVYRFSVPKTISQADLFVNIPKIRYHSLTKISCCLKNVYGCNPYPKKYKYHKTIDNIIVSLNRLMKPDLCIVDGVFVQGQCECAKLGLVMAGTDPVAVDAAAARISGIDPEGVRHIQLAHHEGIGEIDYVLKGDCFKSFQEAFPRTTSGRKVQSYISSKILSPLYHSYFHI